MRSLVVPARVAAVVFACAASVVTLAPAATADTATTISWSNAVAPQDVALGYFDSAVLPFPAPMSNVSQVQIATTGYAHAHSTTAIPGYPTVVTVALVPSGQVIWSATLNPGDMRSMALDIVVPPLTVPATGLSINATPPQSGAFHNFSPSDTVTVWSAASGGTSPGCQDVAGVDVCTSVTTGTQFQRVSVPNVVVGTAATHEAVGEVDIYAFTLPNGAVLTLPCVVLTVNGGRTDPCDEADGEYVSTVAFLFDQSVDQPSVGFSGTLASVGVCNATYAVTVAGIGVSNFPAYTIC